jgi:protein-S-isoprenylcysteine O-methyltransferase Ste14
MTTADSASNPADPAVPAPPGPVSAPVAIGNTLFHYRNGLFPVTFLLLALVSRPQLWGGTWRSDLALDAVGFAIALTGQALRAVVIGLAYIIRGGKDRRIHAETLVVEGLFAHSRNPLYVGNMLVYLGLFVMLHSVVGYAVGVPFFFIAYLCITLAEEHFLFGRFGAAYADYCRRVPRYLPNLAGIGRTVSGMRFHWRRLIRKEYGSTFSWMTTALALVYWESFRNRGAAESQGVLRLVLLLWAPLVLGYLAARYLKKTGRLQD